MGRQKDGYIAGYRDEVRQAIETIPGVPSKRWNRGYEDGKAQARDDLEFRQQFLHGLEELNDGESCSLALRQAAVRLVISDTLRWTDPSMLTSESLSVLSDGIDLLGRSSFSEDEEEMWITSLLEAGWSLVPAASEVNQGAEAA
jgi:hypothetical protein